MGNLCPHHCPGGRVGGLGRLALIAAVLVGVGLAMAGSGHGSGLGAAGPATAPSSAHMVRPPAGAVARSVAPVRPAVTATHAARPAAQRRAAGHGLLWWAVFAMGVALAVTVGFVGLLASWDLVLRRRVRRIIGGGSAAPPKPAASPPDHGDGRAGSLNGHREGADAGTVVALRRAAGEDR